MQFGDIGIKQKVTIIIFFLFGFDKNFNFPSYVFSFCEVLNIQYTSFWKNEIYFKFENKRQEFDKKLL